MRIIKEFQHRISIYVPTEQLGTVKVALGYATKAAGGYTRTSLVGGWVSGGITVEGPIEIVSFSYNPAEQYRVETAVEVAAIELIRNGDQEAVLVTYDGRDVLYGVD